MKIAFTFLPALTLAACSDICANTPHQTITSPDGAHQVVLFDRDCGATTGFTTQVSVVEPGETADGKGNVFVADGGEKAADWGGPWAEVRWTGPKQLLVRFDRTARVFDQNESMDGVQISFEAVPR